MDNELEIPDGSHSPRGKPQALAQARIQPREERPGPCPEITLNPKKRASGLAPSSHSTPRRDLRRFLSPTSATTRSLPDIHDIGSSQRFPLPLDSSATGFPDREGSYATTISTCSKYSPFSVGAVTDSDEYLDIPIQTIKQSNREIMKRSQRVNRADSRNSHHPVEGYRILTYLEIHGGRGRTKKKL